MAASLGSHWVKRARHHRSLTGGSAISGLGFLYNLRFVLFLLRFLLGIRVSVMLLDEGACSVGLQGLGGVGVSPLRGPGLELFAFCMFSLPVSLPVIFTAGPLRQQDAAKPRPAPKYRFGRRKDAGSYRYKSISGSCTVLPAPSKGPSLGMLLVGFI